MNIEQVYSAAVIVTDLLNKQKVIETLGEIVNSLRARVGDPGNASHQEQFSTAFDKLRKDAKKDYSEIIDPDTFNVLEELNVDGILPEKIFESVKEELSENQFTLDIALKNIESLYAEINNDIEHLNHIIASTQWFNLEREDLPNNTASLTFIVPRDEIESRIDLFQEEVKHLNRLSGVFSEISYGHRVHAQIRSISSSDLVITIVLGALAAKYLSEAVKNFVDSYKTVYQLQGNVDALTTTLPENLVEQMKEYIDGKIDSVIEDYVENRLNEVIDKKLDKGRKAEVKSEAKHLLKQVARRIDRGFRYIISLGKKSEEDKENPDDILEDTDRKEVVANAKFISMFKKIGAPLLSLEDSSDPTESSEDTTK